MVTQARLSLLRELSRGDYQTTRDRNHLADALVVAGLAKLTVGKYGSKGITVYIYSITAAGRAALAEAEGAGG